MSAAQGGGLCEDALELIGLVDGGQIVNKLIKIPVHDAGQIMPRQADTVIGDAILREVVGADLLAAISHLHLRAPAFTQLFLAPGLLEIPEPRPEHSQGLLLVFELGFFILAGDDQPRWQVGDAYSRVGGVHALAPVPGGAVDIDANIAIFDFDFSIFIGLGQHNHLCCRGMNTPIGLGNGHALYAMGAALVFHAAIGSPALHDKGNILDAALLGLIDVHHFDLPAASLGVAAVHAEKLGGKKCGLITAGSPWMVTIAFFSSMISFGSRETLTSSSSRSFCALRRSSSSKARSRISPSSL